MMLLIGLGNPGKDYAMTRHNLGFLVIDEIARELNLSWSNKPELQSEVIETNLNGTKVILAKPQTFMNRSGEAAQKLMNKFNIPACSTHIIYDDVALPFGTLRLRLEGSAGGHNGIKSLISSIGSEDFVRFRCGVGEKPEQLPLDRYVLSSFSAEEKKKLNDLVPKMAKLIIESLGSDLEGVTHNLSE